MDARQATQFAVCALLAAHAAVCTEHEMAQFFVVVASLAISCALPRNMRGSRARTLTIRIVRRTMWLCRLFGTYRAMLWLSSWRAESRMPTDANESLALVTQVRFFCLLTKVSDKFIYGFTCFLNE